MKRNWDKEGKYEISREFESNWKTNDEQDEKSKKKSKRYIRKKFNWVKELEKNNVDGLE